MSKLLFSSDGSLLFHCPFPTKSYWSIELSFPLKPLNTAVAVWDMNTFRRLCLSPGYLIGVSRDGSTFLTQHTENCFSAWETATGAELAVSEITPDSYALHQRVRVSSRGNRIQVYDVLKKCSSEMIVAPDWFVSNMAMLPDDQSLIVTLWQDTTWGDIAQGECIEITKNEVRYRFDVNCFVPVPSIGFSIEHDLLLIGNGNGCMMYTLSSGNKLKEVSCSNASIFHVNPQDPRFIVAATRGTKIYLLDVNQPANSHVVRFIREKPQRIRITALHPRGLYVASSLTNGDIHLWDIRTGEMVTTLPAFDQHEAKSANSALRDPIRALRGCAKGEGLSQRLLDERKQERERERK